MSSDINSIYSQENLNPEAFPSKQSLYKFDRFSLDSDHLMLYENDLPVALAPKVVETLVALIEKRGALVSKSELMRRLWKDSTRELLGAQPAASSGGAQARAVRRRVPERAR